MHQGTTFKLNIKLILSGIILLNYNVCLAQANSSYLDLLEGEATNLILDSETKAPSKNPLKITTKNISVDGELSTGLTFDEFMKALKINYIGTYFFAKRLSTANQKKIYSFYQSNNDPQAIRTQVIQISKNK